uniref:Uncharacterized protein n=1 Tax=Arundo donax TaxID=35708 RepID=A0A0A9CIX0_ARUDO
MGLRLQICYPGVLPCISSSVEEQQRKGNERNGCSGGDHSKENGCSDEEERGGVSCVKDRYEEKYCWDPP